MPSSAGEETDSQLQCINALLLYRLYIATIL